MKTFAAPAMLSAALTCAPAHAAAPPAFALDCRYVSNAPRAELDAHPACAARQGDTFRIAPAHLKAMRYWRGLAEVAIDGQWHYVKRTGQLLAVLTSDNGADPFEEGLTRARVNGKIAFYDRALRQKLPPAYDWAWPFRDGRALVCTGCRPGPWETERHTPIIGGLWGCIDRNGKQTIAVTHTPQQPIDCAAP